MFFDGYATNNIFGFEHPPIMIGEDLNSVLFSKDQDKSVASISTDIPSPKVSSKALYSKIYECSFESCPKVFYKRWNYSLHMKMHLNIRQFKCEYCSKAFTQKCNYNKHIKTHTIPNSEDRKNFK
mmetsp:Transcript_9461/g.8330  ORF Transcript_9461/g.8330 Transcript_9461/m.8330 type:complete len:125 (+) Transcript_9461:154-528(+)